jgi:16S rRNA (cytosine967-C5)-methyltransferase
MADTPGPVRNLLRIGAAQLWCLDTPVHAAVGETVEAARARPETERAAGFLNAVLRKASGLGESYAAQPPEAAWPDSLVQALRDSLGVAATRALARAARAEAALDLATWPGEAEALAQTLGGVALSATCVRLADAEGVEGLPGYQDGRWWVQDRAAQAPVTALGDVAGRAVVDLCAAPGGKALQLAAAGAHVTAIDRSRVRLERLRENAVRTGLTERMEIVEADATTWRPDAPATHVLLDAPCSALGTLRRHPEGAWIKSAADIARFPALQERLLRAALAMCAPGGVVVYCVCTPLRGEGRDVVERVLADGGAQRVGLADVGGVPERWLTPQGDWLTLPDPDAEHGLHDVFFVARLRKPG